MTYLFRTFVVGDLDLFDLFRIVAVIVGGFVVTLGVTAVGLFALKLDNALFDKQEYRTRDCRKRNGNTYCQAEYESEIGILVLVAGSAGGRAGNGAARVRDGKFNICD